MRFGTARGSRYAIAAAFVALSAQLVPQPAHAQAWPARPIRVIVPFPPGNTTDIMTRLVAPIISEHLGQQLVVDNRPGASGMLGTDLIAKSPPDGYTIGTGQGGPLTTLPHTSKTIPYDALKDFAPIALSTTNYLGIVASPNAPFKTLGQMITYAKANPNKLTVGTNGEGGFPHLAFENLRIMGGFSFTHVPYKGSAQIVTDLIGGQVEAGIDGITGLTPHIRSGRIVLMAITNKTRVAPWMDTPTANETVPGYESGGWFGYMAPAGTPAPIVKRLNEEINAAMKRPDVVEKLTAAGLIVVNETP
ncbi:MAG TPA: tripartite tricarboxylate transporter substrate binding protein, partial [Burkholderiales bacterium]